MKRAFLLAVLSCSAACGGGGGGGTGGGSGGGGGASGGAFLVDRTTDTATPQLARDGTGAVHLLTSAPTLDLQGHAYTVYGRCASGCGTPAGWSYAALADGAFSSDVKLAVEPGGTAWVALFTTQAVRFGSCSSACTTLASWTFTDVAPPQGQTWRNVPRGRAFAVSASGFPRLLINGNGGSGNVLLLLANDGTGWTADPVVDVEASAVSLHADGEAMRLVVGPSNGPWTLTYAECMGGCATVANWAKAEIAPGNPYALGLDRGAGGALHLAWTNSSGATDRLMYGSCAGQCLQPGNWTTVEVGDGNDGRGGLDVSSTAGGAVAIAGATAAGMAQTLNLRRCSSNCAQAASWSGGQIEAGADVRDSHPAQNGSACDEANTLRYWTVGETAQVVPYGSGWLLGYDATSYARCLSSTGVGYVSGKYVRLWERPAP